MLYGQLKLASFGSILDTIDHDPMLSGASRGALIGAGGSGLHAAITSKKDKLKEALKHALVGGIAGAGSGAFVYPALAHEKEHLQQK